ncbi:MAG: endolytic transglycosylase MltG [Geitlerinemataceae cyanobacterium]
MFIAALGAVGWGTWRGWTWWQSSTAPPLVSQVEGTAPPTIRVEISPGTPVQQIGNKLETSGVIRSAMAWNLWSRWLRLRRDTGDFQAGIYQLSPAEPLETIASKIWRGEVMQQSFTIPEGWSLRQMAQYFETEGWFSAEDFLAAASEIPYAQFPWLPSGLPHLEGYLYPDTYQLPGGDVTPAAAIEQMLRRFEQVALPAYRQGQNPLQLTLHQWVTLGSIVEKESVVPQERQRIAGVFTQRLKKGMKLQADPTVEYGLGIRQTVDKPLTFAQVETPSPYNTYLNTGLTPTPIASPGIASLEATLSPEETEYLYFMARYDGTHIFSRTLAEHEEAIATVEQQLQNQ